MSSSTAPSGGGPRASANLSTASISLLDETAPTTDPPLFTADELYQKANDYYSGLNTGHDPDPALGFEYLQRAAQAGHAEALYNTGVCWEYGQGGAPAPDPAQAVRCYERAALEFHHTLAYKALGYCHQCGVGGLEINYETAFEYYQKAANAGLPAGIYSVGYCYESGQGVEPDLTRAVELYETAAQAGHATAYKALGYCYRLGKGVEQDLTKAKEYYEKGAQAGNLDAIHNLAVMYQNGEGMEDGPHLESAMELYQLAARYGHKGSQYNLGRCYHFGSADGTVPVDLEQAVHYYTLSAKGGNASAMVNLAVCWQNGWGVPYEDDISDEEQLILQHKTAIEWYEKAIGKQSVMAMLNLGSYYLELYQGEGADEVGETELRRAVQVLEQAAAAGSADALYLLSECYHGGLKIKNNTTTTDGDATKEAIVVLEADAVKAEKLLWQAAEGGSEAAKTTRKIQAENKQKNDKDKDDNTKPAE